MSTIDNSDGEVSSRSAAFTEAASVFTFVPLVISEMLDDCIVVLDTSTLILPYDVAPLSLESIKKTLTNLVATKRLVIPEHVAREFGTRRPQKIAERYDSIKKLVDGISSVNRSVSTIGLVQASNAHHQMRDSEATLNNAIQSWKKSAETLLNELRAFGWRDPVVDMYRAIGLGQTLRSHKLSPKQLASDSRRRIDHKLPPGFKDAGKSTNTAGDIEIWQTILELGREQQKPLILVTSDLKSDWWHRAGAESLFVRVELVDEYGVVSGGKTFSALQLHDFLKLFGADAAAVEDVKEQESLAGSLTSKVTLQGDLSFGDPVEVSGVASRGSLTAARFGVHALKMEGTGFRLEASGIESGSSFPDLGPYGAGRAISGDYNCSGSFLGHGPAELEGRIFSNLHYGGQISVRTKEFRIPEDPHASEVYTGFVAEIAINAYSNSAFIPSPSVPNARLRVIASGTARTALRSVQVEGNRVAFDCPSVEYVFDSNS